MGYSEGKDLINSIDTYSKEVLAGSERAITGLWLLTVPSGPDIRPYFRVDNRELRRGFSGRERWAVEYVCNTMSRLNRNFGAGTEISLELRQDNPHLVNLFRGVSSAVQGILHPDSTFGPTVVHNQVKANDSYYDLLDWAESRFR